ncbi:MAG: cysteine--tRNA ligase [Candidatus Paceibacterota bacterium]|jgi:cysteinyl-tRNA synthetase
MKLYNTLTKKEEEFKPINGNKVGMYTCGPTVYNFPHIGNYRAYIFGDVLKRALVYVGYDVNHIMNITDIDDKTIRDSKATGKSLKEFTEYYTNEFFKDRDILNILPATKYTKATDYVKEMVVMIEKLLEKGFAYKGEDGSIYFSIKKFPKYGELNNLSLDALKENAGGRIIKDEYEKDDARDFALWKMWDESDGDVFWETSLGKGRPGWHIECSAMSTKELGNHFDIHTGGIDNMFPHHENEIAQSECATGEHFVNYWMHNAWLLVDGKKMSKSLGNFYTLRDIIEKNINPLAFRYLMLMASYRTPINFTWEALVGTETALKRLYNLFLELGEDTGTVNEEYKNKFKEYLANDLDTPRALTVLWDVIKDEKVPNADRRATVLDLDQVLGLGFSTLKKTIIPEEVQKLIDERESARITKDFNRSDELRKKINDLGFEVKDAPGGPLVYSH